MPLNASYSSTQIPPWLEAIAKAIAENSSAISREPYRPYNRDRIAPFSKEQMEAQNLSRITGEYKPYFANSRDLLQRSAEAFPDAYQRYKNPHDEAVINRIAQLGGRTLNEQILPALESNFVGLGQHGSLQHRELAARAARDLQENVLAQQTAALQQGYGQAARLHESDRIRAGQAAEGMQNLGRYTQAGRLADITALEHSGQQQQGMQQQHLNTAYNDFLTQRNYPRTQLAEHAAAVQGLPHSNLTYGREQFPNVYQYPTSGPFAGGQPNTIGQLGSLAGQLYGINRMTKKEGGSVKKKKVSKKRSKLGDSPLTHPNFAKHPKVGGKTKIPKRIV